jgi:hypothetical protein
MMPLSAELTANMSTALNIPRRDLNVKKTVRKPMTEPSSCVEMGPVIKTTKGSCGYMPSFSFNYPTNKEETQWN